MSHSLAGLRRLDDRLTVALFCTAIALPLLATLLSPAAEESAQEQRVLAPAPQLPRSWSELRHLPDAVASWYDDHLVGRDVWIRWRSQLWLAAGMSPTPRVLVGRDGWWFDCSPSQRDRLRTGAAIPESEIDRWQRSFEERRRWLAQQGIPYLLVLVPSKGEVYPEHLPGWARVPRETPFGQLARRLASGDDFPVLDLGPVLSGAKTGAALYYRTDIHWNEEGAYTAYRAILAALAERVDALRDARPVAVSPRERVVDDLALARMLGLAGTTEVDHLLEVVSPRLPVDPRTLELVRSPRRLSEPVRLGVGDPTLPRAIVFRDSFATALMPFLSEHFEQIVYRWSMDVERRAVLRSRPDVVIHEIWAGSVGGVRWGSPTDRAWREPSRPWLPGR